MRATNWASRCSLLGIVLFQSNHIAIAAEQSWSAEASAGLRYDSNVVIEEADVTSEDGDGAAVLDLSLDYEIDLGPETSLEFGYGFGLLKYFELGDFDRQIHNFTVDLQRDFGMLDVGVTYGLYHARLDGDGFLTLNRASPYISFAPSAESFLRFSYAYSDHDLIGRSARDAEAHQGYADFYYFFDGIDRYLRLGYEYETRDAVDTQFSFDGHSMKADLVTAVPFGGRDANFSIGYLFEQRDYEGIAPSIAARRDDTRHTLSGELEVELGGPWFTMLEYRYRDAASNLAIADYQEQRIEWRVGVSL